MKLTSRFIKGILIIFLAVLAFQFNPAAVRPAVNHTAYISVAETQIQSHYFMPGAFAQQSGSGTTSTTQKPGQAADIPNSLIQTIAKASSLINTVFNPLIYFLTKHIGNLLSNDYIYGDPMGQMLQGLWVVSRNIVNIVFVLMLLFMALKYIFSNDESTDLKKALPMFVLMLVAVNFSWLGTKLVLDAANVATNVAFAIPSGISTTPLKIETKPCKIITANGEKVGIKVEGACQPAQIWMPFGATENQHLMNTDCTKPIGGDQKKTTVSEAYRAAYNSDGKGKVDENSPVYGKTTFCWKTLNIGKFSRTNAAYQLTYGMAKVQDLTKANTGNSISKVGIGTLFSVFIQIVYIVAFGSLFIALIARVAFLWLLVAFSPFMVLLYFLKNQSINIDQDVESYISFSAFASWAFAPAKVAAVWAVGFIMITAGQVSTSQLFTSLNEQGDITARVFSINSLFMGMDNIQEFIWLIMTIGIIWMGTFAVLTKLKGVGQIMNNINDYGKNLAREVASSPKWAPIIPMLDAKEGVKFKSWAKAGIDPLKAMQDIKSKYTGPDPTNKFREASRKFRGNTNALNKLRELSQDSSTPIDKFYSAFAAGSGLNKADMKEHQKEVERLLRSLDAKDPGEWASKLKRYAESKPDTVPPPAKPSTALKGDQIKTAITEALKAHNLHNNQEAVNQLNAEITAKNLKTKDQIIAAANTIAAKFKTPDKKDDKGDKGDKKPADTPPPSGS